MASASRKLKLPRIHTVRLRRFSLFAANPNAEFDAGPGVLCLVGANGIGKSTLLSAVNFCLTGVVPDPNRVFESMDEYYKFTRSYASSYFRGRIAGADEDEAEIAVTFSVASVRYEVRRGLFEPDELRGLTITNPESLEPEESLLAPDDMPRSERHRRYVDSIVSHIGLASFEEFVFLQHFVFTFDEQRKTLLWNARIMERALYRAFGFDPNMAKQADSLRREIQQTDSRVRNSQWEATRMRKRINEIRAQTQLTTGARHSYDTLLANHEELTRQFDEDGRGLREAEDALKDAHLRLADQSVRDSALREEYARLFELSLDRPPLAEHPFVAQSLAQHVCGLCGNDGSRAHERIALKARASTCPLCDSELPEPSSQARDSDRLRQIDRELASAKASLRSIHKTLESLRVQETAARQRWDTTRAMLDGFDKQNTATLDALRKVLTHSPTELSLADYREQLAVLEGEKKTAYDRREELKRQLLDLQHRLEQHYREVEESFVPRFADLAQRFLGMPLTVQMDARASDDVKLIVTVKGTTRRLQHHLSESQRFFLDIALRMALTQHMSDPISPGGMFIDTPEGSLDIAYEKRAGDMLAMFATAGHQIIMTANLNSSQLLLALANRCGRAQMRLCRMMDWAELSEVQHAEEGLFDRAYEAIESAMNA